MELEGKVIQDLGIQSGTSRAGNPWAKKEVIIETFGTYPKKVKLTIFGEQRMNSCPAEVGMSYRFNIEVESREYNERWYTDVNAFSSMPIDGSISAPAPAAAPFSPQPMAAAAPATSIPPTAPADPFGSSDSDDLPF
ncbi:MAG: DUF3127 domain-containing protein [Muribaculaceae bacterium]|nr:DUF3127 domain-containing protein [Muribaculaceae bacterium]